MAQKFEVKDIDRGWKRIVKQWKRADGKAVRVGIQGSEAQAKRDGVTNVLVASVHEFGGEHIPERPFLRSTFDENRKKYEKELKKAEEEVTVHGSNVNTELTLVGESYREDVINKITQGKITPPLSEATIARRPKQDPTPLFDTGQLVNSIRVVLEK